MRCPHLRTIDREALAFTQIGAVRQIITEDKIISEFETKVGITVPP